MKKALHTVGAIVAAGLASHAAAAPAPGETTVLGPFTGHYAMLHPDNVMPYRIAYYGTDLGWTYEHAGKLQLLFGDTAATERGDAIQASTKGTYNDGFGSIDLAGWTDPSRITSSNIPLIKLGQNPGTTEMAAINPGHAMELFKTPLGGFSNGTREFGVFYTSKPQGCRADADCSDGLTCDTGLGFVGERPDKQEGLTLACTAAQSGCNANTLFGPVGHPIKDVGFCIDRTSSIWAGTDMGRVNATGVRQRIGIRSTDDPRHYTDIREWLTSKFANVTMRTVEDFVPGRGPGHSHQDYKPAKGQGTNRRVFLWGRPGFVGVNARGRSLSSYFAYVDMPGGPGFSWDVHYFTGTDQNGAPTFGSNEQEAVALDLDSTLAGVQAGEAHDIVNQVSVAWVDPLNKWVMFYGGGITRLPNPPYLPLCGVLELFVGSECKDVIMGNGAIRMRTADNPWGPWTPPQDVIVGGDAEASPLRDQYAVGGVLRHPACTSAGCAPKTDTPQLPKDDYGFLYGANIIEQWLKPAGPAVDVIWNASTWDPYRIILLRTRINP